MKSRFKVVKSVRGFNGGSNYVSFDKGFYNNGAECIEAIEAENSTIGVFTIYKETIDEATFTYKCEEIASFNVEAPFFVSEEEEAKRVMEAEKAKAREAK